MPQINLGYGNSPVSFDYDEQKFSILGTSTHNRALSDVEIGERFDQPFGSKPIEEIVEAGETVLFVVPDATRRTASGQIVNLLIRRLIANGTMPFDIGVILATGIHRRVTDDEKRELLTPFIFQRIKTLDHNPRDLAQLVSFGETASGVPIQLNRALTEYDKVIIVGGITFHYFAGFTGGRKLICPGLASSRTVSETHKLAFDCAKKSRRAGVGAGLLNGNAVHEVFIEIVERINPAFAVSTVVNENGEAVEVFCGDWRVSHQRACDDYATAHIIEIPEKRPLVIASCGGSPHDINFIQAHKTLDAAARVCTGGGTIILLAECADGLGRNDFLNWFAAKNSTELAEKLCERYQVNGQTAWNLLTIAERFDVKIITALAETEMRQMRLEKRDSIKEVLSGLDESQTGYILPFGAKFLIKAAM